MALFIILLQSFSRKELKGQVRVLRSKQESRQQTAIHDPAPDMTMTPILLAFTRKR